MIFVNFNFRNEGKLQNKILLNGNKSNWDNNRILKWKSNQKIKKQSLEIKKKIKIKKNLKIHKKKLKTSQKELQLLQNSNNIDELAYLLKWKRSRVVQWFTNRNKLLL